MQVKEIPSINTHRDFSLRRREKYAKAVINVLLKDFLFKEV